MFQSIKCNLFLFFPILTLLMIFCCVKFESGILILSEVQGKTISATTCDTQVEFLLQMILKKKCILFYLVLFGEFPAIIVVVRLGSKLVTECVVFNGIFRKLDLFGWDFTFVY